MAASHHNGDETDTVETFKRATASCVRALAGQTSVDVSFSPGAASATPEHVTLPAPKPGFDPAEIPQLRGIADSMALKVRFHNAAVHRRYAPVGVEAVRIFDALETARTKAIGAKRLTGVHTNISATLDASVRAQGLHTCTSIDAVPLPEAIHCAAMRKFLGNQVPDTVATVAALWEASASTEDKQNLNQMADALLDQESFARHARGLLQSLDIEPDLPPPNRGRYSLRQQ